MTNLCTCSNHNPITCAANLANMSRFNAMLTNHRCFCLCHYTPQGEPISAQQWAEKREQKARVAK